MPSAISASTYNIELRDKTGALKAYLTPFVSKVGWEWNRLGGCGRCSLTINKAYRDIIFAARDDIQIRVPNVGYDPYTKLLIHFDGADGSTDDYTAESGQTVSLEGTAQLDTAQKVFGSASLLLDGNSDYVTVPDNVNWYLGVGDFTIECRVMFAAIPSNDDMLIVGQWTDGNNYWAFRLDDVGGVQSLIFSTFISGSGVITVTKSSSIVINTWYDLMVTRNGNDFRIFVGGTQIGTTTTDTNEIPNLTGTLIIGKHGTAASWYLNGWIDEVRIRKGIADHITTFTPEVAPYTYSSITSASKLVYRGFIANVTPTLKINQDIVLDVRGYYDLLKKIVVHDTGDIKSYPSGVINLIGEIVDDIADTFITPNAPITKGTIDTTDGSAFDVDSIDFLCSVDEALRTLSELAGDVEYGVDEDLVFFWRTESTTISRRFFVGNNVSVLERRVNWNNLVNKIYLIGGDVAGSTYKTTIQSTDSQDLYYLAEEIINNSSITTAAVANQYAGAILQERSNPQFTIRAKIVNTDVRLEDTIPIGLITFYDAQYDQDILGDVVGDIIGAESAITSNSIANPTVVTATAHGFQTGQIVIISGNITSDPTINGTHTITVTGVDTFTVPVNVTTGGTGGVATSSPANGSDIRIGLTADGGDDVIIGGQYSAQIERISYDLSDTSGRFNIEVQLGDTVLETAAKIKRLELALASIQQGS